MPNNEANQTLQIISIQHELSMNIGLDIHLEPMLYTFMERMKQRLSLLSVAVVYKPHKSPVSIPSVPFACLSFPRKTYLTDKKNILDAAHHLYVGAELKHQTLCVNSFTYYLFVVPDFGTLILERTHKAIDNKVLEAIKPLMTKLSISCLACVQHENLIREIDYRNKAEHLLKYQSLHDPLTGLGNRKQFNDILDKRLHSAFKTKCIGAIFIIDLDRFKVINDDMGHGFGDLLLKAISLRLIDLFNGDETLARIGGDEFALLLDPVEQDFKSVQHKALKIANDLHSLFVSPFYINQQSIKVTISTGIQFYPIEGVSLSNVNIHKNVLINNADLAMYAVKRESRDGYQFYNKDIHANHEQRTKIENALRDAISKSEFQLYYQPIVNEKGDIVGAEALIRWNSKELGWVSPAEFIPLAEESGCILEIGNWVLEEACTLFSKIDKLKLNVRFKYISINVSPRQFACLQFENHLLTTLDKYNLPHETIRIEITEGIALENMDIALLRMQNLKKQGCVFMLDDFGSGYSSLSYIHQLPLHTVKIDRGFITDIHSNEDNQVIVNAVIDICNHFRLECIVEGVESKEEAIYLTSRGIKRFQGYHFFRPASDSVLLSQLIKIQ